MSRFSEAVDAYEKHHTLYRLDINNFKHAIITPEERESRLEHNILPFLMDNFLPSFYDVPRRRYSKMFMSSADEFEHQFGEYKYICLIENNAKIAYIKGDFNTFSVLHKQYKVYKVIYDIMRITAKFFASFKTYEYIRRTQLYDAEYIAEILTEIESNILDENRYAEALDYINHIKGTIVFRKFFELLYQKKDIVSALDEFLRPLRNAITVITTDKISTIPPGCEVWSEASFLAIKITD